MTGGPYEVVAASGDGDLINRIVRALAACRYKLVVTSDADVASALAPRVDCMLVDADVAGPDGVEAFCEAHGPIAPVIEIARDEARRPAPGCGLLLADASVEEVAAAVAAHIDMREQDRDGQAAGHAAYLSEDCEE